MAEIITLTLSPSPINPFRINHSYFDTLPLEECVIATGAMMDFLQRVYMKDTPYTESGNLSNRIHGQQVHTNRLSVVLFRLTWFFLYYFT